MRRQRSREASSRIVFAALGTVLLCGLLTAQTSRPSQRRSKEEARPSVASTKLVKPRRQWGQRWLEEVDQALAYNKRSKGSARPIFWLRVLGALEGST